MCVSLWPQVCVCVYVWLCVMYVNVCAHVFMHMRFSLQTHMQFVVRGGTSLIKSVWWECIEMSLSIWECK